MIELNFDDSETISRKVEVSSSKATKHNINGLVFEVSDTQPRDRPAVDNITEKTSQMSVVNSSAIKLKAATNSFSIKSVEVPVEQRRARNPRTQGAEVMPAKATPAAKKTEPKIDEAAGKWNQREPTLVEEKKTEPPPFTEEDWMIFRQHMDPINVARPRQLQLDDFRLIANAQEFVCSICHKFIKRGHGVAVKDCRHEFCRPCLADRIKKTHDKMGKVKCPQPIEDCDGSLEDEEIKEVLGSDYDTFVLKIVMTLDREIREREHQGEAVKHDTLPALLDAEDRDLIENFEAFECAVCFGEVEIGQGIILKNCLHKFCKECLIEQVKHSEEFEVKCPHMDDDGNCEFTLRESEIRYLVPAEIFEKHIEKSLKFYEGTNLDSYHCKKPDCKGFILVDKNLRGFMCQACGSINCIGCKAIHKGKNCQEYQDKINPDGRKNRENEQSEKAIKNLIEKGEAMWCPSCGIPVMKNEGCDYITCSTCKLGICWVTKKPRHAITKSNGVVVDGCHCRENGGPKCHELCNFCH